MLAVRWLWVITSCKPKRGRRFGGTYYFQPAASICRFLINSSLNFEDGGYMFFRNVTLSPKYMTSQQIRQYVLKNLISPTTMSLRVQRQMSYFCLEMLRRISRMLFSTTTSRAKWRLCNHDVRQLQYKETFCGVKDWRVCWQTALRLTHIFFLTILYPILLKEELILLLEHEIPNCSNQCPVRRNLWSIEVHYKKRNGIFYMEILS